MGLERSQTVIRYVLLFFCLATLGFDIFFIHVYQTYNQVVFTWKFYAHMGLVGVLVLIILASEIVHRISNYRRVQRERASIEAAYETSHHAPYLPPTSFSSSSPESTEALMHELPKPQALHYPEPPTCCQTTFSIIRLLILWAISAALLNITVRTFETQGRFVFSLPFPRDSSQGIALNNKFSAYDPHDLFFCPDIKLPDLTTILCHFDQITMILVTVVAICAIIEAIAVIVLVNRTRSPRLAAWAGVENERGKMKKRVEVYDDVELGNAQVVAVPFPCPSPMVPSPAAIEMHPYGAYHQPAFAAGHLKDNVDEKHRSLPPLPLWVDDKKEMKPGYNPFEDDVKDKKFAQEEEEEGPEQDPAAGPSASIPCK